MFNKNKQKFLYGGSSQNYWSPDIIIRQGFLKIVFYDVEVKEYLIRSFKFLFSLKFCSYNKGSFQMGLLFHTLNKHNDAGSL